MTASADVLAIDNAEDVVIVVPSATKSDHGSDCSSGVALPPVSSSSLVVINPAVSPRKRSKSPPRSRKRTARSETDADSQTRSDSDLELGKPARPTRLPSTGSHVAPQQEAISFDEEPRDENRKTERSPTVELTAEEQEAPQGKKTRCDQSTEVPAIASTPVGPWWKRTQAKTTPVGSLDTLNLGDVIVAELSNDTSQDFTVGGIVIAKWDGAHLVIRECPVKHGAVLTRCPMDGTRSIPLGEEQIRHIRLVTVRFKKSSRANVGVARSSLSQ